MPCLILRVLHTPSSRLNDIRLLFPDGGVQFHQGFASSAAIALELKGKVQEILSEDGPEQIPDQAKTKITNSIEAIVMTKLLDAFHT